MLRRPEAGMDGEGARSRVLQGGFGAFGDAAGGVARFAFRGLEELFGGFAFRRE